jgi:hypothetical protein
MILTRRTRQRAEAGQSIVEFALVLPVFLVLLLGAFDVGRGVLHYNMVSHIARQTARGGIATPAAVCASTDPLMCLPERRPWGWSALDVACYRGRRSAALPDATMPPDTEPQCGSAGGSLTVSAASVPPGQACDGSVEDTARVRASVSYPFTPVFPIFGGTITLTANSCMRRE